MDPFVGKPVAEALYQALLHRVGENGDFRIEVKKTSVHVAAGNGAFLGVHPRAAGLLLNIVLDHALEAPRVVKSEQVSRRRFHNELMINDQDSIDSELLGWIKEAYRLKTT